MHVRVKATNTSNRPVGRVGRVLAPGETVEWNVPEGRLREVTACVHLDVEILEEPSPPEDEDEEEIIFEDDEFVCEECGRVFDSERGLQVHGRVHEDE